ncbi:cellulose synthase [Pandoraea sputorum]|uniref:cellulose synthase n=1 Tax=Pandoraea sputorum TaxID=93222 RepID=UPI002F3E621D
MTSKQKLTIVNVIRREGVSQKTGRPYDMRTAQCILWQTTSEGEDTVVGTVTLPNSLKETEKGDYIAEFAMSQSMDGSLVPRIVSLLPCPTSSKSAPPKAAQ